MEVRPGYKRTDVGVIPDDWQITAVGRIAEVKTGPFGSALHEKDYVTDGTPIITVEHLTERGVRHSNLPLVSDADKARLKAYLLRQDDIVFSRVGSVDRNALIKLAEDGWLFSGRLLRVRLTSRIISAPYMSHHFHSEAFKQRVRDVAVGQTMASINTQILKRVSALLPPTKAEQESIAEALSDADSSIESLEQLIAKKRQLKQGAMQELLTGKRRMPGFESKTGYKHTEAGMIPEDWALKPMRALTTQAATYGVVKAGAFQPSGIPMLRGGDIKGGCVNLNLPLISVGKSAEYQRTVLRERDIVIALVGYPGESAVIPEALIGANISRAVGLLRPSSELSPKFLSSYLNSPSGRAEFLKPSAGSAQMVVNLRDLNLLLVPLPLNLAEQEAIAKVFSDMDEEIAALEAKLAKAHQIKQGMMQELLTGRIRLA